MSSLSLSSLNFNELVESTSISTKILKLLKNNISNQLVSILNIFYSSGVFPAILKIAKVILVHKRDSRLDFSRYCSILLLSYIEKVLESLILKKVYKFFNDNNLISILHNLALTKYSTVYALTTPSKNIKKKLDEGNIAC